MTRSDSASAFLAHKYIYGADLFHMSQKDL